ncbi:MAG: hypothetical protein NTV21_00375 [Planctomycetota bacterium]|nr:hypothetical protein [Planctomycetota bacterium]
MFLHGLAAALLAGIASLRGGDPAAGLGPYLFIGGLQFLWMVPACLVAAYFKLRRTLLGMGIGVAITFLINAACFGVIAVSGFG